jgi:PPOX class probable F420-dependent enzyme
MVAAVDRNEARRRVAEARVGHLATVDHAGAPHVVPLCFVLHGETLYWAVDQKPKASRDVKRLSNIRVNAAAQVVVDHYEEDWTKIWWVRLTGRARVLEDGPEAGRAMALLAGKFSQYRDQPPQGPAVAIDVTRWSSWESEDPTGARIVGG